MSARTTASSVAMQAPCARYCSIGCAASPSSVIATGCPVLHRLAVAQDPHAPGLDALEHAQDLRACILKCCHTSILAAFRVPAFDVVIGMEDSDEIVELAAAQRIMHEMGARPGPQHDVGAPEILRDILALEDRAIGDVTRIPAACRRRRCFRGSSTTCRRSRSTPGLRRSRRY